MPDRKIENIGKDRMVKAFQREMGREFTIAGGDWGKEKSRYFLSGERQKVFQKLCEASCATAGRIANMLGMKPGSARWHLAKLLRGGFVGSRTIRSSVFYYPSDMLGEEDIALLSVLQEPATGATLKLVIGIPGSTQGELARFLGVTSASAAARLRVLTQLGVAMVVADGRYKRYYATDRIARLFAQKRKKANTFRTGLLIRLKREMFSVEVLRSTPDVFSARLSSGTINTVLTIPLNPYGLFFQTSGARKK